jgi:putative transcriptional regulator
MSLYYESQEYTLAGKLLVAMPYIMDPRFSQAVIYVCGHDDKGSMGLIINRHLNSLTFRELLTQLEIPCPDDYHEIPIYQGGPMEVGRGFVLHTSDHITESTVIMPGGLALTATLDVLKAVAEGEGPQDALLALGYVGWLAGQLEKEYQNNNWISINATPELIFHTSLDNKWRLSMASIGVDPNNLSIELGHA